MSLSKGRQAIEKKERLDKAMLIFPNKLLSELDKNINSYFPLICLDTVNGPQQKGIKLQLMPKRGKIFSVISKEITLASPGWG